MRVHRRRHRRSHCTHSRIKSQDPIPLGCTSLHLLEGLVFSADSLIETARLTLHATSVEKCRRGKTELRCGIYDDSIFSLAI